MKLEDIKLEDLLKDKSKGGVLISDEVRDALISSSQRNYDFVMAFGRLFRDGMKPISARDKYVEAGQKLMKRFLDGEDAYPK